MWSLLPPLRCRRILTRGHTILASRELNALEQEIQALAGSPLNLASPKQVSMAVFGRIQSTSREALQQTALHGAGKQQRLASLILQHRQYKSRRLSSSTTMTAPVGEEQEYGPASTSTSTTIPEEDASPDTYQEPLLDSDNMSPEQPLSLDDTDLKSRVETLFHRKSKIHSYWKEPLLQLTRPSAQALVAQLDSSCPMGYNPLAVPNHLAFAYKEDRTTTAGKKGSFLAYCREQKMIYPDAIILTRCGDFYETFGTDAIMLVEHCGLNAMAGKAKAGCPYRNIQATLDGLTAKGFRVAVYEEASDTDAAAVGATAGAKARMKQRFLAQMVSTASPTYLYDLVLSSNDALAAASGAFSRPHVGIISSASGYTFVEVSTEEQSVRVSERWTAEAVACRLSAYPPADPLVYVPSPHEYQTSHGTYRLPFLPIDLGGRLRTQVIPPTVVEAPRAGVSETERAKNIILPSLLQFTEGTDSGRRGLTVQDFTLVSSSDNSSNATVTSPLYSETATQLGLMGDKSIPPIVNYLVPDSAPAATKRFLRRLLLTPPPPQVADAMRSLIDSLQQGQAPLPPLTVPPEGKLLALLRAGQASAHVYGEVLRALNAMVFILHQCEGDSTFIESLMTLLEYETGMKAQAGSLRERCIQARDIIEEVVNPIHHAQHRMAASAHDQLSYFGSVVPSSFFERNEVTWRGRVRREAALNSYDRVDAAAAQLAKTVAEDFWLVASTEEVSDRVSESKSPIVQDIFNNLFALRDVPPKVDKSSREMYIHPRDRFGKLLRNRFTTEKVQEALSEYVDACDKARQDVASVLVSLSQRLYDGGHVPAVVQASHANLILSALFYHASKARAQGWHLASTYEGDSFDADDSAGSFLGLWPYWMDHSIAVANNVDLKGMWVLTAPNMAGKSTVLRSTAAAALLTACGLCAPLETGSRMRLFDRLFVRGASSDVPTEAKSAFGAEMGDVAALLRCCGSRSLVFVDELGRGTSPRDGTRLAAAVLEKMADSGMSGMFATHLHDILELPLKKSALCQITKKRMAIHERDSAGEEMPSYTWTYRLEDGVCIDSMALITAARFGLPQSVIDRAEELKSYVPDQTRHQETYHEPIFNDRDYAMSGVEGISQLMEGITGHKAISIPPAWSTPPFLEGEACVYVLELDDPQRFYVGETENLRIRLQQHRAKGADWSRVHAIASRVKGGKSQARSAESRLIQQLARAGLPLESISDGRSIRSSPLP